MQMSNFDSCFYNRIKVSTLMLGISTMNQGRVEGGPTGWVGDGCRGGICRVGYEGSPP